MSTIHIHLVEFKFKVTCQNTKFEFECSWYMRTHTKGKKQNKTKQNKTKQNKKKTNKQTNKQTNEQTSNKFLALHLPF